MTNIASVFPSPDYPSGGYAIVRVSDPLGVSPNTKISIYDLFRERYLGMHDWQPDAHEFGPYETTPTSDGAAVEFCIGPEIVNQIAEFTNIRIDIGGHPTTLTWPDNVLQDPSAVPYGTIYKDDEPKDDGSAGLTTTVQIEDVIEKEETVTTDPPPPLPAPPPPAKRKPWWLLILLLLLIAAGLGAWWLTRDTDEPPVTPPEEPALACTLENALNGDAAPLDMLLQFADRSDAQECNPAVDAAFALRLTEQAATNGDATALAAIGDVYNPFYANPLLEDRLGVVLSDDAAIAFSYYLRARDAGGAAAADALAVICAGTETTTDFIVQQDRRELCE